MSEVEAHEPVSFSSADLRTVPDGMRGRWFSGDGRKWHPKPEATQRVLLGAPCGQVDMIALRRFDRAGRETIPAQLSAALPFLRPGGILFWVDEAPELTGDGLQPLDPSGRVAQKVFASPGGATLSFDDEDCVSLAAKEDADRLVHSHYNLALSLARRFSRSYESTEDLEQVALAALVGAAGRYRPDRNASFSTFATASILGEIKRHFRDKTWMLRVPRTIQENYLSVREANERLTHRLGASPTVDQLAADLDITVEDVLAAMEAGDNIHPNSLDRPSNPDEGIVEVPVEDQRFEASLNRHQLQRSLPRLSPIEQLVLQRLFFEDRSQRQVAEELDTNQMHVSRLMTGALRRLRKSFHESSA
jgi:RNA polymerase sigma-B factor